MKMNKNEKLNRRQWVLYEYLKLRAENKEWKTREQILNDLSEYYDYRPKTNNNLYYNKSAVLLTKDILKINNNQTIQKIVISDAKNGIKIANEKEAYDFINNNMKSIIKKLKRHYNMFNKVNLNNQYRLTFGKGYEKLYIESFINEFE